MSYFFWVSHSLTLRKENILKLFPVHNTQHLLLSHTLYCYGFKIATTAASGDSLGTLRSLINFTAGGKALCWEIFFAWHTRCCDLVRAARRFSLRSRESWSKARGPQAGRTPLPVSYLSPACFHASPAEPGSRETPAPPGLSWNSLPSSDSVGMDKAWDSAFLTHSQPLPMLLVWKPPWELLLYPITFTSFRWNIYIQEDLFPLHLSETYCFLLTVFPSNISLV